MARIDARRAAEGAAGGGGGAEAAAKEGGGNASWALSLLTWLRHEVAVQPKLFPPGLILHQARTGPEAGNAADATAGLPSESFVAGVDPGFYDSMILSGSSMFTSHMPQSYARVLVGNCHEPYARSVTPRELCLG